MNIDSRWMLEPKCPHKEIPMKKSTLGLVVCLVITVIISVVAVISEKKAKAERDAYLISQKHNERRERCNYGGDEMHEPPDPPSATLTNRALGIP